MGKVKTKAKAKMNKPVKKPMKKSVKKMAKPIKVKAVKAKAKTAKPAQSKTLKSKSTPKIASGPAPKKLGKAPPATIKKIDYTKAVTPLGDRLIVRLVSAERKTAGGLYIPETVSDVQGHLKGEVLAAGSGVRNKKGQKRPLDVTVGDKIYFGQYSATKIIFGLEELHIVKESDVLGVAK